MQFTSKESQEGLSVHVLILTEMNGKVEVTWRILRAIAHWIMVHTWISDEHIHFPLMYTTHHIFPVLPIKHLVNQDGEPTTRHKMETGTKTSASNIRILFCPCVVQKATAQVDGKESSMCHQSQKEFWGIFSRITQHQKGYLI